MRGRSQAPSASGSVNKSKGINEYMQILIKAVRGSQSLITPSLVGGDWHIEVLPAYDVAMVLQREGVIESLKD